MSITSEKKTETIKEFALKKGDTGSPEVQIAILTSRINTLTEHFKIHKKDNHSRRGLLILVGRRKKLMTYLKKDNEKSLTDIAKKLKIKVLSSLKHAHLIVDIRMRKRSS